jgi:hypothetical protein
MLVLLAGGSQVLLGLLHLLAGHLSCHVALHILMRHLVQEFGLPQKLLDFGCLLLMYQLLISGHVLLIGHNTLLLVGQALVSLFLQAWKLLALELQSLELVQVFLQLALLLGQLLLNMLLQLQGMVSLMMSF